MYVCMHAYYHSTQKFANHSTQHRTTARSYKGTRARSLFWCFVPFSSCLSTSSILRYFSRSLLLSYFLLQTLGCLLPTNWSTWPQLLHLHVIHPSTLGPRIWSPLYPFDLPTDAFPSPPTQKGISSSASLARSLASLPSITNMT